jgi:hypothetical protein
MFELLGFLILYKIKNIEQFDKNIGYHNLSIFFKLKNKNKNKNKILQKS